MKELNRRDFIAATAAGTALSLSGETKKTKKPNLLVIHTDQQARWTVSAYGNKLVGTPHIDSLATNGARLDNFFTNSAVCTPSRGSILTGRYPHSNGAFSNNKDFHDDEVTWAMVLRDNGYDTGYSGKWHLDGPKKPGWAPKKNWGFTDNRYMFNRGHYKKIIDIKGGGAKAFPYNVIGDEKTFTTDWLTAKTIDFMTKKRTKPWAYMVSLPDPHQPFTVRKPYDTMYKPADMPVPKTYNMKPESKPDWARQKMMKNEEKLKKIKAQYCGEVKCIDDNVGKMLAALKKSGQLDNTIIVFTTDHGEFMGEHGLMFKNKMYETAYKLPFIISWPGHIKKGTVVNELMSNVDFQPTILNLMGLKGCGREQGKDASGILLGKKVKWDNTVYAHHSSHSQAGIFTPEYHLAFVKNMDTVLFDRKNDPDQEENRVADKKKKDVLNHLKEKLQKHHAEVESPTGKWLSGI